MNDNNTTLQAEHARTISGVEGRAFNVILWPHRHGIANQTWGANRKNKAGETVAVEIRFDDNCKNGHSSFAITGTVYEKNANGRQGDRFVSRCGCVHDDVRETFPELAPLLKWHGTHTDEPLHYVANAVYHAGDRDHWGLRKGEAHKGAAHQANFVRFGTSPIWHPMKKRFAAWAAEAVTRRDGFTVVSVPHENRSGDSYKFGDKYTFKGFDCKWHECPFDTVTEANEWGEALAGEVLFDTRPTLFGEGKARDLAAAREAAAWPDATDAELMQEPDALRAALIARLPALMEDFRRDMVEVCGFVWEDVRDPAKFV